MVNKSNKIASYDIIDIKQSKGVAKRFKYNKIRNNNYIGFKVIIWSISRYPYLKKTIDSLFKHLRHSDKINVEYYLFNEYYKDTNIGINTLENEPVFTKIASNKCIEYCKNKNFNGITSRVAKGSYGWTITDGINEFIDCNYMISIEEDCELIKDIDLDFAYDCLEQNKNINQLCYNITQGSYFHNTSRTFMVNDKEYTFHGGGHWYFSTPTIARMSYLLPNWLGAQHNVHHEFNHFLLDMKKIKNLAKDIKKPSDEICKQYKGTWCKLHQAISNWKADVIGTFWPCEFPMANHVVCLDAGGKLSSRKLKGL